MRSRRLSVGLLTGLMDKIVESNESISAWIANHDQKFKFEYLNSSPKPMINDIGALQYHPSTTHYAQVTDGRPHDVQVTNWRSRNDVCMHGDTLVRDVVSILKSDDLSCL